MPHRACGSTYEARTQPHPQKVKHLLDENPTDVEHGASSKRLEIVEEQQRRGWLYRMSLSPPVCILLKLPSITNYFHLAVLLLKGVGDTAAAAAEIKTMCSSSYQSRGEWREAGDQALASTSLSFAEECPPPVPEIQLSNSRIAIARWVQLPLSSLQSPPNFPPFLSCRLTLQHLPQQAPKDARRALGEVHTAVHHRPHLY
jgi:hypothetical protein